MTATLTSLTERMLIKNLLSEQPDYELVREYLKQDAVYVSASKRTLAPIASMPRPHARNSAARLLRECLRWAHDADVEPLDAALWMTAQPLFRALVDRAGL
jgi:hypothetical protein